MKKNFFFFESMSIVKNKHKKRDRCQDRPSKYICKKCYKAYQSKGALNDHMRKMHQYFRKSTNKDKKLTGRPRIKNQMNEKILMEEKIYEDSLLMLFGLQEHCQKQKTLFLTEHDDFLDLTEELTNVENTFKIKCHGSRRNANSKQFDEFQCFLKKLVEFVENPKNYRFEEVPNENKFNIKLKKLAFAVLKFGHFLEKTFYEYFLVLNLEILKKLLSQSNNNLDLFVYKFYEKTRIEKECISEEVLNRIQSFEQEYFERLRKFIKEDQ